MVDLSVASRSISQLEELGYVERTRDPADGRAWLVQVTPAGRDRLDQVRIAFAAHVRGLLPGWTDAEVDSIADQLRRFGDTIATANAAADRAEGTPA
jgi:DNA-binding MarR family transcriptional regulator